MPISRPSSPGFRLTAAPESPAPLRMVDAEIVPPPPYSVTPTAPAPQHHGLLHPTSWFRHSPPRPDAPSAPRQLKHSDKLMKMAYTLAGRAASPDIVAQAAQALADVTSDKRANAMLLATELYPDNVMQRIASLSVTARLTWPDADFVRNARRACVGCDDANLSLEVVNALREAHPHRFSDGAHMGTGGHVVLYAPANLAEMDALTNLWSGIPDASARRSLLATFVSLDASQRLSFVADVGPLKSLFNYPSLAKIIAHTPAERRFERCQEFLRAV
ncbi:hypothetical protein K438DRAFT_1808852 [Mycena galopus ATCC 62051]|nr:hypothetical protein K438DRAFT_1808852 [Mycena galopus ATCC 62051]